MPLGPLLRKTGSRLGDSSPTPTPRRARERSSPPIGSQPMGVGESCYSVPTLVRFPLVRACRTTLREAQQWVSQAVLLFAAGGAGTKVPNPARGLGQRPIGKRRILAESPGVVQGANPNVEDGRWRSRGPRKGSRLDRPAERRPLAGALWALAAFGTALRRAPWAWTSTDPH